MQRISKKLFYFFLSFILYILLQHAYVGTWNQKAYLSLPVLFFMMVVAYLAAFLLKKLDISILIKVINFVTYILISIALLNIFTNYSIGVSYGYAKAIFPFGEPSHFALFSGVFFVLYILFSTTLLRKIFIIGISTLLAILFPNTTMLIFPILMVLLLIKINIKNIILILLMVFIFYNTLSTINYFSERLNISEHSNNVSSLVYLQGLDDAKTSFVETKGLGLGFQMMGTQPPSEITLQIIYYLGNKNSKGINRQDGGFLASKIVAELGLFGIFLLIIYVYLFSKSFFYLKKNSACRDPKITLIYGIIYSFIVYLIIRGIGYFNPSVFIFLVSFFYYMKFIQAEKN